MKPGTRIGPYEITAPLGAGGMGEVYRATDTRLHRDVAIKVLPEALARDRDRLARFEREAQLLAALNHPHIAAIYGLENAASGPCLILEHVAGETLAERLRRGPLAIDEAIPLAAQMASALEAAHEKGIVHRDLKPANVKITPDGKAKVLDFGLAKALADDQNTPDASLSPTLTAAATRAGMILGTAAYMSPEQARGRAVDRRADIWAFGVVLHEMLTGMPLFQGETVSELLASVIKDEPSLERLPAGLPAAVHRLLARCLVRDPRLRLRDMGEARIVLDDPGAAETADLSAALTGASAASMKTPPGRAGGGWIWALGGAVTAAVLLVPLWLAFRSTAPEPHLLRTHIEAPEGASFRMLADFGGSPILSPDGTQLAFVAVSDDRQSRIWIRPLDSLAAQAIPGTEGAYMPFWSAEGRSIGFFSGSNLKRVDLKGGSVLVLADVTQGKGGAWNADDVILFAPGFNSPLLAIDAGGGETRQVTTVAPGQTTHRLPQFMPDGEHFLFFAGSHEDLQNEQRGIYFGSLSTSESHFLIPAGANGLYSDGYLLTVRDGSLMAYPFDAATGRVLGSPQTLGDSVQVDSSTWRANMGVSTEGTLVYQASGERGQDLLSWLDRSGKEIERIDAPGSHVSLRLSPRGRYLATETQISPNADVWIHDLGKGTHVKLTLAPTDEGQPVWSHDEARMVYQSNSGDGSYRVYQRLANGAGPEELIPGGEGKATADGKRVDLWPMDWSADGRFLLLQEGYYDNTQPGRSLAVLDLGRRDQAQRILMGVSDGAASGRFSPDGRWIAFSTVQGRQENVFVAPFHGDRIESLGGGSSVLENSPRWQVSLEGGNRPLWRADMKEIYYLRPDNTIMAVEIGIEDDSIRVGATKELFVVFTGTEAYSYDVTADGQRFIVSIQGTGTRTPLVLLSGWTSLLGNR